MDFFHKVWHDWKRFAQFLGDWIARLVLTIFYFTVFLPFGLGVRLWGDPLAIRSRRPRWLERATRDLEIEDARRMF